MLPDISAPFISHALYIPQDHGDKGRRRDSPYWIECGWFLILRSGKKGFAKGINPYLHPPFNTPGKASGVGRKLITEHYLIPLSSLRCSPLQLFFTFLLPHLTTPSTPCRILTRVRPHSRLISLRLPLYLLEFASSRQIRPAVQYSVNP